VDVPYRLKALAHGAADRGRSQPNARPDAPRDHGRFMSDSVNRLK
jgi:hypothetical protein